MISNTKSNLQQTEFDSKQIHVTAKRIIFLISNKLEVYDKMIFISTKLEVYLT